MCRRQYNAASQSRNGLYRSRLLRRLEICGEVQVGEANIDGFYGRTCLGLCDRIVLDVFVGARFGLREQYWY